jgi:hypothetical protein
MCRMPRALMCGLGALVTAGLTGRANAVEMQPDDFIALPAGLSVFLNYASYSRSARLDTPGGSADAELESYVELPRYAYFFHLGPFVADINLLVPMVDIPEARVGATNIEGTSGIGDPELVSTVWVVNDPSKQEYLGVAGYLSVPVGAYDRDRPINPGTHRWSGTLQVGYWRGLSEHIGLELIADATWYADNNDFGPVPSGRLQQDVTESAQAWIRYTFSPKTYAAVGYYASTGGEQHVNSVGNGTSTQFQQVRCALAQSLTPSVQVYGEVTRDTAREDGFRQDVGVLIRVLKAF